MYDACSVANDFIRRTKMTGIGLTPLRVQTLVYFAHAWMLALHGRPLVEQNFRAWRFGPVVPGLYHKLRRYGAEPVSGLIQGYALPQLSDDDEDLLEQVFRKYGKLTGGELIELCQLRGSPWYRVYYSRKYGPNSVIPDFVIQDYHRRVLEDAVA